MEPRKRFGRLLAAVAATSAIVPLAQAHASVSTFELPGATGTPQAQGPVAEGVPPPRTTRPAPTPAPSPAPTAATPAPAPAPAPSAKPSPKPSEKPSAKPSEKPGAKPSEKPGAKPSSAPAPAPTPTARPTPEARPSEAATQPAATPVPALAPTPAPAPAPTALSSLPPLAESAAAPASEAAKNGGFPGFLGWILGGVAALAALAAAALFMRRMGKLAEDDAPLLERPSVPESPPPPPPSVPEPAFAQPAPPAAKPQEPPPPAEAQDEAATEGPLSFAIEARQLSITLTAATLSYRITLSNSGRMPLHDVAIAGDMISAHASLTRDQQLASLNSSLTPCHSIERIPAGQSVQVTGEFRLPLPLIQPIRRGDAALFVPLARLRVEATGNARGAIVKTALIGQRSERPGGVLQPFRLDLGPRIYREVTQKIFS